MKSEHLNKIEHEIRTSWFKDHVATYKRFKDESGDEIEFIQWSKPNSSFYSITYLSRFGTLCVFGDVGEAIYQWHHSIGTLKQISRCSLEYFAGKCQASEYGKQNERWYELSARNYILNYIQERSRDGDETYEELSNQFSSLGGWAELYSLDSWIDWMEDNGFEFFGDNYHEYDGIGMEISSRCRSHLIGLQMAFQQLEKMEDKGGK